MRHKVLHFVIYIIIKETQVLEEMKTRSTLHKVQQDLWYLTQNKGNLGFMIVKFQDLKKGKLVLLG